MGIIVDRPSQSLSFGSGSKKEFFDTEGDAVYHKHQNADEAAGAALLLHPHIHVPKSHPLRVIYHLL